MEPTHASKWRLGLLGNWQLRRGTTVVEVGIRQQRCIAALALHGPRSRGSLAGLLWPESSESHAAGSLRTCLFQVSHRLPSLVRSRDGTVELNDVAVDVDEVHRRIDQIESSGEDAADPRTVDILSTADLLPGWYEDWVVFEQERLRHRRLVALDAIAAAALDHGDGVQAVRSAEAAVALEPLRESSHLLLVRGHLMSGNRVAALRSYEGLREVLGRELGLAPSPEFTALLSHAAVGAAPATSVDGFAGT